MIRISYSTINMVLENSHNWANKQMGYKPEDHDYYTAGKAAHTIIQKHLSKKEINPDLINCLVEEVNGKRIPLFFPVVEEKDFDPRCKFIFYIKPTATMEKTFEKDAKSVESLKVEHVFYIDGIKDEYEVVMYADAHDKISRFGEIKTSSSTWSLGKFQASMQRKVYGLAKPNFTSLIGITAQKEPEKWKHEQPKAFRIPFTQRDRDEALAWLIKGIKVIEGGDYSGGLNEEGKCTNYRCYYGVNCQFK